MRIRLNGRERETGCETLYGLADQEWPDGRPAGLIMIYRGYQAERDFPLEDGDEITFLKKGEFPPKESLEHMMAARHTPGVHAKVKQGRVAVAGLGGLGSRIALDLARTGVGRLHLVDFDVVEPSNLNRQNYRICHLGMPKAEAIRREIREINPYIQVDGQAARVTEENAAGLFREDQVVCEAFDDPEAKAALVNSLLADDPDKRIVAASGLAGYGSGNGIHTRRVCGHFYLCGDETSASEPGRGLMAPRAAICAGHQANMALRLLLGLEDA